MSSRSPAHGYRGGLPPVTVIVLNWCDEEGTAACLDSVLALAYPELSVLLVDNGSTDGSAEALRARYPSVDFMQTGGNEGYSGGNNRGIRYALDRGARYVLVLNNDTLVPPETVRRLVEAAEATPGTGAVAPTIMRMDDPETIWYGGGAFDAKRGLGMHWNGNGRKLDGVLPRPVSFFSGCAVLLSAEALEDVGLFAEDFFMYVEDAELSFRLTQAGWTILHHPEVRIQHRVPPPNVEVTPSQIRFRDRNRRRLVRRHYRPIDRLRFSLWFLPTRLIHLVRYTGKGDLARAAAILRGISER